MVPPVVHLYIDVRDFARAHIPAIENKSNASNQRWLFYGGIYAHQDFIDVARAKFPQYKDRMAIGNPGNRDTIQFCTVDISKSNQSSGIQYVPYEKTLAETMDFLLKLKCKEIKL